MLVRKFKRILSYLSLIKYSSDGSSELADEDALETYAATLFPSEAEKSAMAGTSGTPGSANKFVTDADARNTNARTPASHAHGNLTNAGLVGTTADLPLKTTTGGAVTVGAFGNGSKEFCEGNDARLSDARTPTAHNHNTLYPIVTRSDVEPTAPKAGDIWLVTAMDVLTHIKMFDTAWVTIFTVT